jgi:hypothetical protein
MLNALVMTAWLAAQTPPPFPFEVASSKAYPELTERFQHTDGWTGSDGAYSIQLSKERTLWLFGDTFIGKIENGRRVKTRMVNNTAAWQALRDPKAPLRFFWGEADGQPAALLKPEQDKVWYWPGDGVMLDGKLYLFCSLVRYRKEGAPGFQFDWFGMDLLRIDNPLDEPTHWKIDRRPVPYDDQPLRLGMACVHDDDWMYAYGLFPIKETKAFHAPMGVARIRSDRFKALDMDAWEFWRQGDDGPRWTSKPGPAAAVFEDGGTNISISKVPGVEGWLALYIPHGLGTDIIVRHAPRPEGPWSAARKVYSCPEAGSKLLVYAAKLHPELTTRPGQLVITYCRNTGSLAEHVRRPDIYFPQAVEVQLKVRD